MVNYYDLLLTLVPGVFVAIVIVLSSIGLSLIISIPIAALASVLFVGHGLFVNPPLPEPLTDSE